MDTETADWEPIEADALRIGHFIKIDHRWFDHPFVRRSFQVSSERELAVIREVQLTRMFVDRKRSVVAGEQRPAPTETAASAEADAATLETTAAEATQAEAVRIREQRACLEAASTRDRVTLERARALLPVLGSGDPSAVTMVDAFIDYLVAILNNSTTPLTLMAAAAPRRSSMRLALQIADAVSLVALVGKRMGLGKQQLRVLTQAAATHTVGLARMPPQLIDEEPGDEQFNTAAFRNYPLLGANILNKCGFQAEVLRLVVQHRERPDGSGFPRGLNGDAINPLALILGAVREFQIRCDRDTSPVLALSYLHRHCRGTYGAEVIVHLANAVLVYPVGTFVQMSDGRVARIVGINEAARMAPMVDVYEDRSALREWTTVDLSQAPGLSIVRALDTSYLPPRMFAAPRPADGEVPRKAGADADASAEPAQASGAK